MYINEMIKRLNRLYDLENNFYNLIEQKKLEEQKRKQILSENHKVFCKCWRCK